MKKLILIAIIAAFASCTKPELPAKQQTKPLPPSMGAVGVNVYLSDVCEDKPRSYTISNYELKRLKGVYGKEVIKPELKDTCVFVTVNIIAGDWEVVYTAEKIFRGYSKK